MCVSECTNVRECTRECIKTANTVNFSNSTYKGTLLVIYEECCYLHQGNHTVAPLVAKTGTISAIFSPISHIDPFHYNFLLFYLFSISFFYFFLKIYSKFYVLWTTVTVVYIYNFFQNHNVMLFFFFT